MSLAGTPEQLKLPESLQAQLAAFRSRVWFVKVAEALCSAAFGVVMASLILFVADRLLETPDGVRLALFIAAMAGCSVIPYMLYRWVWKNRRPEQLARTFSRTNPIFGDHLLGVIELVRNDAEQSRSRDLCEAAVTQVAEDARSRDFTKAVPNPRHRLWGLLLAVPAAASIALLVAVPDAAKNTWTRFLAPWSNTPRYTFAAIEPLADTIVVAHGEGFTVTAALKPDTAWKPKQGLVRLGNQRPVPALLTADGKYEFTLPSQIEAAKLDITIGDYRQHVAIEPILRPELSAVTADVALPAYLERAKSLHKDVRGGAISLVKGANATFSATAGRELFAAKVDGQPASIERATVFSKPITVDASRKIEFTWKDKFGLAGKEPFNLSLTAREDETPSLVVEDLPRQRVVLETEILNFKVRGQDDFGIKRIGMQWQGADDPSISSPANGDRVIAAGGPEKDALDIKGTFSAKALGIEPQPINLRVFVEDYFPGRPRVYSPTYTFYVLNAEQHAIWLTEQLSKWHRQSLEVRDREMQLFETNKQLRELPVADLDKPENRKKIDTQATAERANGRRLTSLVVNGEDLVKQAMRNPEFGVGHLEKWAEMLQILKDIAGNRMPSVADLLKQAAQAPLTAATAPPTSKTAIAGQVRANSKGGQPADVNPSKAKPPAVPQIADRESSQNSPDEPVKPGEAPGKKNPSSPSLKLPVTTVLGKAGTPPKSPDAPPALDEAVKKQEDLLAEFEKISEELNKVLANLEGSTLVKRLKAASRLQYRIAGRIDDLVPDTFGTTKIPSQRETQTNQRIGRVVRQVGPGAKPAAAPAEPADTTPSGKILGEMASLETKGSQDLSNVMDDMQSYFERRRFMKFKSVLDEMRKVDVIGALRTLGDDLKHEQGVSIAQAESWSDTLDRWAEDLVDPSKSGSCPGSRSKGSLPPSIVLEVLQILEAEINLREETRVAEQARPALASEEFSKQADKLSETQSGLKERILKVTKRILDLPDGEKDFAYEIDLLGKVEVVMDDAAGILATPDTGTKAMAAETEAIELLLKSKRINPGSGGGGGSSPGGGGKGTTRDSALSLIGTGLNEKEVREDQGTTQATGDTGPSLPEEFRSGLDEYFNRLEKAPVSTPAGGQ